MSMLEIDKLSKVYKSGTFGGGMKPALRQVSFDIDKGEVVSLIGESGSGKSTLGKIILRLISASAGRVMFEGTDVTTLKQASCTTITATCRVCSRTPSAPTTRLYKADRVFELVRQEYFRAPLAAPTGTPRSQAALETVALNPADVLNKFPHQLSGGQQQRLLVARALLLDVKLLIADEIISMLDASTRVDVLNMLVRAEAQGPGGPVHHPRPLARQLHQRPHRHPALRRRGRDGRHRKGVRQPPALLHQAPAHRRPPAAPEMAGGR